MYIAHLETGRHRFGGPQQVLQLMNALANAGHRNTLYAARDSELLAHARVAGHEIDAVQTGGDLDPTLTARLIRRLRRARPDILHVHSRRGADLYGGPAAHAIGVPAVLTRRVDNPLSAMGVRLRFWPYQKIVAISDAVVAALRAAGVDDERLVLIRDAIDVAPLVLSPERDWVSQALKVPLGVPLIGVVAQFIPRKGHALLFDALPSVLAEFPAARVLLFGRGPLEVELRAATHELGLAERVVFCGFRDDLARILPCLDLIVHPATAEGMGVALLEAAAAALPVVAFHAGGVGEVVIDGETGLLVASGDTAALAGAVCKVLGDRELARAYGVAARRRIQASFSVSEHVERHVALYKKLLAVGAPP
ncbi:MAG: glycosyltransferase [Pseudomonadota bacterium]